MQFCVLFLFCSISKYKIEMHAESSVSAQTLSNVYAYFIYIPNNTLYHCELQGLYENGNRRLHMSTSEYSVLLCVVLLLMLWWESLRRKYCSAWYILANSSSGSKSTFVMILLFNNYLQCSGHCNACLGWFSLAREMKPSIS